MLPKYWIYQISSVKDGQLPEKFPAMPDKE